MLEHAVRLNLVQWSLKKTLFVQIFFIVIGKRAEFASLLVEEVKVGSALISDIAVKSSLSLLLVPLNFTVPVIVLIIFLKVVIKSEVRLLGGILAF